MTEFIAIWTSCEIELMSLSPPRVSVVVPNYNHKQHLPQRLQSILNQTFQDFELILLDDASTDGSAELLNSFQNRPGTRVVINQHNSGGPFAQWNRGVEMAQGEFVWLAESDDYADELLLETLVAELDRYPNVGIACCESVCVDRDGQPLGLLDRSAGHEPAAMWQRDFIYRGIDFIRDSLYFGNSIASASAVVFRRQVYLDAGFADASFSVSGDLLQWSKLLMKSDFCFVARPLNFTRIHAQSQRHVTSRNGRMELESLRVQEWIRAQLEINPEGIHRGAQRYALSVLQSLRTGRYFGGLKQLAKFFQQLLRTDRAVALWFGLRLPYGLLVWSLKRTLFRHRLER